MVEGTHEVAAKRTDNDLFHQDWSQHGRNTEKMGEWHKNYEQSHYQGDGNTGAANAGSKQSWWHGDVVAPTNQPKHQFPGTWEAPEHFPKIETKNNSGVSLAYLTVDTEESATRFIKDLFKRGLVS